MSTFTRDRIGGITRSTCDDCGAEFANQWGPTILHWQREHHCIGDVAA